jgi:hypothetical protein
MFQVPFPAKQIGNIVPAFLKLITTCRLSTRVQHTFNPSLFPSEAGAVTRCRGAKGRRRVKLRTLKDGHRKWVRPSRLDCMEQYLLRHRLGRVDQRDAGQLEQVGANEIRLRF